jgi:hypothetical protein
MSTVPKGWKLTLRESIQTYQRRLKSNLISIGRRDI